MILPLIDFYKNFGGHAHAFQGRHACVFYSFFYTFFYYFFYIVSLGVSPAVSVCVSRLVVNLVVADNKAARLVARRLARLVAHACIGGIFRFFTILDPGDHPFRFQFPEKSLYVCPGPVPLESQISDACGELPTLQPVRFVILPGSQDINNVEPGLEPGEFPPGLREHGIRPDFSPEQGIAAVQFPPPVFQR